VPTYKIKEMYKQLSRVYHPDKTNSEYKQFAGERFNEIETAYNTLMNPIQKTIYDAYQQQGLEIYETYKHLFLSY
jgi:DnaJ-class molecular chaperone